MEQQLTAPPPEREGQTAELVEDDEIETRELVGDRRGRPLRLLASSRLTKSMAWQNGTWRRSARSRGRSRWRARFFRRRGCQ
jgi:hypothetical protein